ncbi:hypothetical protein [Bacillus andreraoultii]|uniref:hypothetical protein n=1 Tax=Bacillus andreraoultii TaxID=1499685 RepID=UPI00053B7721|nr:hypothetical protein [Bacillus andreraoultii]
MKFDNDRFYEILIKNNMGLDVIPPEQQIKYIKPDNDFDFHSYRIILLIKICGIIKSDISPFESLYGRRKFAFYDFLIRYPFYLEKVCKIKNKSEEVISSLDLKTFEKEEVFSPMVKYIRGPWDFEYENIFNYLISKDLVNVYYGNVTKSQKQLILTLTESGNSLALKIKEMENVWVRRMEVINKLFRVDATNKTIDDFIEKNLEELFKGLGELVDVN